MRAPGQDGEGGPDPEGGAGGALRWLLRGLGLILLLLTLLPVYRVLDRPETGRFGGGAVLRGDAYLASAWWGVIVALILGGGLAYLLPAETGREKVRALGRGLASVSAGRFALLAGAAAGVLSLAAGLLLFQGLPTLVDGMVALLHARMLEGGRLAVSLPSPEAAWVIPNTVLTPRGWISQYPSFPSLLLAGGMLAGAHWLVGPVLVAVTVVFGVLTARHLFPDEPGLVRLGGVLLAGSPFLIMLGGGYLSHLPAAAFGAVALYSALRARDGGWPWALLTGAASGAMVPSRPWLGLLVGVAFPALLWILRSGWGRRAAWLLPRLGAATLGGLPFALGWGWYNHHFFGHPLRMGYSVAFGPSHDLGFHHDPWGNLYGPLQALGFTAQDLLGLGVYLLETPFPAVALVGLFLLVDARPSPGVGVLLGWALLPVLANVAYWHHGSHLGPRMLYESAPAWVLLTAAGALSLARKPPGDGRPGAAPESENARGEAVIRLHPRNVLFWTFLASLAGAVFLAPSRAASYRWDPETLRRITVPPVPREAQALVFVHGSWTERIAARLQADGMRLDSIESGLRRNDICRLHTYAMLRTEAGAPADDTVEAGEEAPEARTGGGGDELPTLDFRLLAETPDHLEPVYLTEGNRILVQPDRPITEACRREARADRGGIISLPPLIWQGDLPTVERGAPMFVRDLGWEENGEVITAFPDRRPYLLLTPAPGALPELRDYEEGMRVLWGEG